MPQSTLIQVIGEELMIARIPGESAQSYSARVVYSALSQWARQLTFGVQSSASNLLTKNQIHRKLNEVLNQFLLADSSIEQYFWPSEDVSAVNIIRDNLVRAGDIKEVGFKTQLSIVHEYALPVGNGLACELGAGAMNKGAWTSGQARVIKIDNADPDVARLFLQYFGINDASPLALLNYLCDVASWEECRNREEYEIFDPTIRKSISLSWVSGLMLEERRLYMGRVITGFKTYDYRLLRAEKGTLWAGNMGEYYKEQEIRETQRALYHMRMLANNATPIWIRMCSPYIHVKLASKLPPQEEALLRYIGWPTNAIDNAYEFYLRKEFLPIIETIIENLSLKREELRYG